jgi:STE24 endopeptidase
MQSTTILNILLGILTFDFVLDKTLDFLNYKHSQKPLPKSLDGIYDPQEYQKSLNYQRTNLIFSTFTSTITFVATLAVIWFNGFGWLDSILRTKFENPILLSLAFFGVIFIISDILSLPFSIYHTFVIEEKFGFNKTTPKTFIADKIKGYLLTIIVGGLIIGLLLYLITSIGQNFWIWFWIFISVFLVVVNMFYTSLILPLFNKLTPLTEGELRQKIEEYSDKSGFDLQNIFVIDGSKRSSKANAFFSGLGKKKKVVLYDTLINNHSEEELVAVLAHEVGHYKKKHIISSMILSILQTGVILFILSQFVFNPSLSEALGGSTLSIHLNLIAFGILFSPISEIIGIFMNIFSRKNEFEADDFAAQTYKAEPLITALKKLSVNNLSNLNPHPAYVFVHYSHPPLVQRLANLEKSL